jgi:hypothetical protein
MSPPPALGGSWGERRESLPPCPSQLTPVAERSRARSASDESRRSEAQVVLVIQRKWSNGGSNTKPRPLQ